MASRRVSAVHKPRKPCLGDSGSSIEGNENNSGSINGTRKKPCVRIVKSRYLQAVDKKQPTKSTAANESTCVGPRPASPKMGSGHKANLGVSSRRSIPSQLLTNSVSTMSSILEPSQLGALQSTVLDGHCVRPELDVSAIKEKTVMQNTVEPENDKKILETQTFLLAYLTAKMESNILKLKAEAERSIILVSEEEEQMRKRIHEKKRRHVLLEKYKQFNSVLDMQITALTPIVAAAEQFKQEYKVFATAVDTTRHELPVKNFHIEGDRREFLDQAEECLKESEGVLLRCTEASWSGGDRVSACLKEIEGATQELDEHLSRVFLDLVELAALVSQQTVEIQVALEEDRLGMAKAQALSLIKQ